MSFYPVPMSPSESSDDSYVSAGEEPLEAPLFEIPLQNAVVAPGTDTLLKCIITANPPPRGELWGWGQAKVEAGRRRPPPPMLRGQGGEGGEVVCFMGLAYPMRVLGELSQKPLREVRAGLKFCE